MSRAINLKSGGRGRQMPHKKPGQLMKEGKHVDNNRARYIITHKNTYPRRNQGRHAAASWKNSNSSNIWSDISAISGMARLAKKWSRCRAEKRAEIMFRELHQKYSRQTAQIRHPGFCDFFFSSPAASSLQLPTCRHIFFNTIGLRRRRRYAMKTSERGIYLSAKSNSKTLYIQAVKWSSAIREEDAFLENWRRSERKTTKEKCEY